MKFFASSIRLLAFAVLISIAGCISAHQHYQQTHGVREREITVGTVQKEIRKGMSAAMVAEVLGSPNIVTMDANSREVWIYDKVSTDKTYSEDSGGGGLGLLGGAVSGNAGGGGLGWGSYRQSAGATSRTQRTLTIVIKFDEQKLVADFNYHTSKF